MSEPTRPIPPEQEKKTDQSRRVPDEKSFRDMLRVDEVDADDQRTRKQLLKKEEDPEEKKTSQDALSTPYEPANVFTDKSPVEEEKLSSGELPTHRTLSAAGEGALSSLSEKEIAEGLPTAPSFYSEEEEQFPEPSPQWGSPGPQAAPNDQQTQTPPSQGPQQPEPQTQQQQQQTQSQQSEPQLQQQQQPPQAAKEFRDKQKELEREAKNIAFPEIGDKSTKKTKPANLVSEKKLESEMTTLKGTKETASSGGFTEEELRQKAIEEYLQLPEEKDQGIESGKKITKPVDLTEKKAKPRTADYEDLNQKKIEPNQQTAAPSDQKIDEKQIPGALPEQQTPFISDGDKTKTYPEGRRTVMFSPGVPTAGRAQSQKGDERGNEQQYKSKIEEENVIIQSFSPEVNATATHITDQVTTNLKPEITPFFFQMVGAIIQTTKPGITSTEVTLNSPLLKGSPFFGMTIVLDKYNTAPDSFNVTIRGDVPAINIINANIEGLMNAYEEAIRRGSIKFRIGQFTTAYETSQQIFHRKGPAGGGKEAGGKK